MFRVDRRAFIASSALASLAAMRVSRGAGVPAKSPLGINPSVISDYSTEFPFADLMKYTSSWVPQAEGAKWGDGEPLVMAKDGRTIQQLKKYQYATTVACDAGGQPEGKYRCTYEGKGRLQFAGTSRITGGRAGDLEVTIYSDPEEGVLIHLRDTDPADPLRNIRLMMPGTTPDASFNPKFVSRCRNFQVIRFMDWMRTNNSPLKQWSDRPTIDSLSYAEDGVPIETMIELANKTGCDPWFTMPHLAGDDFIENFAKIVSKQLDASRRVYVEYSNEVWNHMFGQAHYAADQGEELGLSRNSFQGEMRYYAKRSVEVFKIWNRVVKQKERLIRVLGSQHANPWVTEQVLEFKQAYEHADALAVAPYFGHEIGSPAMARRAASLTVDDILERCAAEFAEVRQLTEEHADWARKRNLRLIAYEGGQHLVGNEGAENNKRLTELLIQANRDPRMRVLYKRHLRDWKAAGGELYTLYNSMGAHTKFGSWGLLENESQEPSDAPKYQGALEFIDENPKWWK